MNKKYLAAILFFVLLISACSAKTPEGPAAPILTDTRVAPPTFTATAAKAVTDTAVPPVVSGASSTPEPPIPTNLPNCTNSGAFVADVTIPDNSKIAAGATFIKTWRVKNTGSCIWGSGYTLTHYSEESMLAPASVPVGVTYPDQTVEVSIELTAPREIGSHRGFFVIKNPAGLIMKIDNDSRLWVVIKVTADAATPTPTTGSVGIPATATVTASGSVGSACASTTDPAKVTQTINALNVYRAQNGLPAYVINDTLTRAAAVHANDMACNKLFAHNGSDGSTPASRVAASGYAASSVTENVYGSYPPLSGQGAIDWWKTDPTDIRHNENLLSTKYKEIGVAYAFFNNFGYYVIDFAIPK
jgi:uncharacterized protein YkwD